MQIKNSSRQSRAELPASILAACLVAFALPAHSVEVGEIPPDFLGKSNGGNEIRLSEGAGRIRIVTFWASWCSPCLKELPVLNAIQEKGGADRVQVIAVNLKESRKQYRKVLRALRDYSIEFVHDQRGSVAKKYGVKGIPHLVIIDVNGRIAHQHIGYNEKNIPVIVDEINQLLLDNNMVSKE